MKILCHVGPWCKEYFGFVARGFDPEAEVTLCSGYVALDQTRLAALYRTRFRQATHPQGELAERDRNVIARCRILRSLSPEEAARHVEATRFAVRAMLSDVQPTVFLSETTDQFLHQILFEECADRGIPAFGIVQTFVNGYFRISQMGERCAARTATAEECAGVLQKLEDKSYVPAFILRQKQNLKKAYLKAWLSNIARVVYFGLYRQIARDRLNYHYWASSRGIFLNHAHLLPARDPGNPEWETMLRADARPTIFVPLQFFPEATIDYWVHEREFIDYENALVRLLTRLSADFCLVVKEHPGVWGHRQPSFYDRLAKVPGLIFCPTNTPGQHCIELCDSVLVWTGSVGFEAALRGKPVLTVTTPYYQSGARFLHIDHHTPAAAIFDHIERTNRSPIVPDEKLALVRYLIEGMDPGRMQVNGTFQPGDEKDEAAALAVGSTLRRHYEEQVPA